ncbi:MLO-like protein 13 isoform X2 [Ipomoea triloba]|nr:MLO-like protein 13 isoform X2 [Ipomoea triloba]
MLLGFISLLLTVSQGLTKYMCIPHHLATIMLPCKKRRSEEETPAQHATTMMRRLLTTHDKSIQNCASKGKVPMMSLEALHQLHIFIFIMALAHVIFCVTTMLLGGARIRQWRKWEQSIKRASQEHEGHHRLHIRHLQSFKERAGRYWRRFTVISWLAAFFKQFHGSVTKSDYVVLRSGFINAHCPSNPNFDFHKYMLRTLEHDFRRIVGISWYLWVFVVAFLLLNISGWHSYFWLSFLPLILLLVVGTKLEHIITELAQEFAEGNTTSSGGEAVIRPSDELFWFRSPKLVLYIIHFILFQNSFEIAFFVWIMYTYGARSCIMERLSFTIPRLVMGAVVQVLCSYSTFPLYALVTQMGSSFKEGMFNHVLHNTLLHWAGKPATSAHSITEPFESITISQTPPNSSTIQLSH